VDSFAGRGGVFLEFYIHTRPAGTLASTRGGLKSEGQRTQFQRAILLQRRTVRQVAKYSTPSSEAVHPPPKQGMGVTKALNEIRLGRRGEF